MDLEIVALTARASQWNHRYLVRPGDLQHHGEAALCRLVDDQTPSADTIRRTRAVRQLGGRPATEVVALRSSRIDRLTSDDRARVEAELDAGLESFDAWVESADWGRLAASSLVLERPEIAEWARRIEPLLDADPVPQTSRSQRGAARQTDQRSRPAKPARSWWKAVGGCLVALLIGWQFRDKLKDFLKPGGSSGTQEIEADRGRTQSAPQLPDAKTFKNVVQAVGVDLKKEPSTSELWEALSRLRKLYRDEGQTPNGGSNATATPSRGERPMPETKPQPTVRDGLKSRKPDETEENVRIEIVRLVRRFHEDVFGSKEPKDGDLLSDSSVERDLKKLFPNGRFDPHRLLADEQKRKIDELSCEQFVVVETSLTDWIEAVGALDRLVPRGSEIRNHTVLGSQPYSKLFQNAAEVAAELKQEKERIVRSASRRFWIEADVRQVETTARRLSELFNLKEFETSSLREVLDGVSEARHNAEADSDYVTLAEEDLKGLKRKSDDTRTKAAEVASLRTLIAFLKACRRAP